MSAVETAVEDAFEALFFSEAGSMLGLLLFVIIVTSISLKVRNMTAVMFPFIVVMAIMYLDRLDASGFFVWHIIILFFVALFLVINFVAHLKKE